MTSLTSRAEEGWSKPPQPTGWGGYSGYFADPDGYLWEVAWGPNTEFEEDGTMKM